MCVTGSIPGSRSNICLDYYKEYLFCGYFCCNLSFVLSVGNMDDWKLKVTPVVRLERPNKTFVFFVSVSTTHRHSPAVGKMRDAGIGVRERIRVNLDLDNNCQNPSHLSSWFHIHIHFHIRSRAKKLHRRAIHKTLQSLLGNH